MKIKKEGKTYEVESVAYEGAIINVNGTSITDYDKMVRLMNHPYAHENGTYSVFVDGDELGFDNFAAAYEYATTKQKNTFRI